MSAVEFPTTPLYRRTVDPLREGARRRDEAIARVEAASIPWQVFAREALRTVAYRQREVTSSAVWDELAVRKIPKPGEGRSMGATMRWGVREGLIEPTATFDVGPDPKHHHDPMRIFRSLVAR